MEADITQWNAEARTQRDARRTQSTSPRRRLNAIIAPALRAIDEQCDGPIHASIRGNVARRDVDRVLGGAAGVRENADLSTPTYPTWCRIFDELACWAWLRDSYQLSDAELDLVLIAFACEIDLGYEAVFAYLQDDPQKRGPTVDLALTLVSVTAAERPAKRALVGVGAPLINRGILRLHPDPRPTSTTLLAWTLVLDGQIVDVLLQQTGLDRRLAPWCELSEGLPPEMPPSSKTMTESLCRTVEANPADTPLRLYFRGPVAERDKLITAEGIAAHIGVPLLAVRLDRLPATADLPDLFALIFREAALHGAILFLGGCDAFWHDCEWGREVLAHQLTRRTGVTILAGNSRISFAGNDPIGLVVVQFELPEFSGRRLLWEAALSESGIALAMEDLDELSDRFLVSPSQIREAVLTAQSMAKWCSAGNSRESTAHDVSPSFKELSDAVRGLTAPALGGFAQHIDPVDGWDDLVVPTETELQLRDLCAHVAHRHRVLDEWGFGKKLSRGKGVTALFAGPPGTGKTMAAEVIAGELCLDLFAVDLSTVVSKYIGETEKNLEEIFTAATASNAILLFDEAEALCGKRSEVRDAHDRYANIEVAYLLQRIERYEGLVILTTNLRSHLDEAFLRRIQFVIEFPFPDEEYRQRIWQVCLPTQAPTDADIDYAYLARNFAVPGGNIKNVVMAAAFLAAADSGVIQMRHLLRATARELAKLGKVVGPEVEIFNP